MSLLLIQLMLAIQLCAFWNASFVKGIERQYVIFVAEIVIDLVYAIWCLRTPTDELFQISIVKKKFAIGPPSVPRRHHYHRGHSDPTRGCVTFWRHCYQPRSRFQPKVARVLVVNSLALFVNPSIIFNVPTVPFRDAPRGDWRLFWRNEQPPQL